MCASVVLRGLIALGFALLGFLVSERSIAAPPNQSPATIGRPLTFSKPETAVETPKTPSIQTGQPSRVAPLSSPQPVAEPQKSAPANTAQTQAGATDAAPEKILAIVNGVKITQTDFDLEFLKKGLPPGSPLTEKLIDETLQTLTDGVLMEQYLKDNGRLNDKQLTDRLKTMRRTAISEYFVWVVGTKQPPPEQKEIDAFISEHPDFFKDRRFYYYSAISFTAGRGTDITQIKNLANSSAGFERITELLDSKNIVYTRFHGYRSSEQIEEFVLQKLKTMSPGEGALVSAPEIDRMVILKLFTSSADPIDPAKVRMPIMNAIAINKATGIVNEAVKQIREGGEIQYIEKPKPTEQIQAGKIYTPAASARNSADKFFKQYGRQNSFGKSLGGDASSSDKAEGDGILSESGRRSNPLINYLKNIWIFSLFLLFPAAFYQFLKLSNLKYSQLMTYERDKTDSGTYRSSQLQRLSLDPVISWIFGIVIFWFLASTSWNAFFDTYYYMSFKQILKSVAAALIGSLILIFVVNKMLRFMPWFIKSNRFIFPLSIVLTHILITKYLL